MLAVDICKEFGWTYNQFYEQPQFFIELITRKKRVDIIKERQLIKQNGR